MRCQRARCSLAATHCWLPHRMRCLSPRPPAVARQADTARSLPRGSHPRPPICAALVSRRGVAHLPRHDLTALLQSPSPHPFLPAVCRRPACRREKHWADVLKGLAARRSRLFQTSSPAHAASQRRDTWLPPCRARLPSVRQPDPDRAAHLCPRFWGRMPRRLALRSSSTNPPATRAPVSWQSDRPLDLTGQRFSS